MTNVAELQSRPALEATAARSYASAPNTTQDPATMSAISAYPPSTSTVALLRISQERNTIRDWWVSQRNFQTLSVTRIFEKGCFTSIRSRKLHQFPICKGRLLSWQILYRNLKKSWSLLLKFIHAADATSVLSKRGSLRSWPILMKSTKVQTLGELRLRGTTNWWAGFLFSLLVVSR